jgi:retron-type reverse transcriptase
MFILRLGVSLLRRSFTGKEEKRILGIKNILNALVVKAFRIFLSGIY